MSVNQQQAEHSPAQGENVREFQMCQSHINHYMTFSPCSRESILCGSLPCLCLCMLLGFFSECVGWSWEHNIKRLIISSTWPWGLISRLRRFSSNGSLCEIKQITWSHRVQGFRISISCQMEHLNCIRCTYYLDKSECDPAFLNGLTVDIWAEVTNLPM